MVTSPLHQSVLLESLIDLVKPAPSEVWVDGTVGAGGHSLALLEAGVARLVGIDRDASALELARARLSDHADRVDLVHAPFAEMPRVLAELGIDAVDGIVLDLGVSSMHLDQPERGFSLRRSGPIDMRMDTSEGATAFELLRELPVDELAALIRDYGEERYARRIAERVRDAARAGELETTLDLAAAIDRCIPAKAKRHQRIHPATRTFQALRIAVNRELDQLDRFLEVFPDLLRPGGRCAVISFHSLEDRRVKRRFRDLAWSSSLPPALAAKAGERVDPICTPLTRKPITASDDEIAANPRARSARLRGCVRFGRVA
jgi:16S rRNA (cytosine1402-N4)-methyltransferase